MLRKGALLLLLAPAALPCPAQDLQRTEPSVLYYLSIPFGGSRAEQEPVLGFAVQGRRAHESVRVDSRLLRLVGGGALEAKWLLVGAVAAGTAVLAAGRDGTVEDQRARAASQPQPCPAKPAC